MKKYIVSSALIAIAVLSFWFVRMSQHKTGHVLGAQTSVTEQPAADPAPSADLDNSFVCPEDYPTEQDYLNATANFISDYKKSNPNAKVADMEAYRISMLVSHNCKITLDNMNQAEQQASTTVPTTTIPW